MEFGIWGLGFSIWGFEFGVWVWGLGFGVLEVGCTMWLLRSDERIATRTCATVLPCEK